MTSRRARALFAATLACLPIGCGAEAPERARNVILISLDTLRPDYLSCYGHARATSPAIDALAARGVRFMDASSSAPWTLPAHTTMFTGLYPSQHGVKDYAHRLAAEATTLAEVLGANDFQTFAVINTWNIANPSFEIFQGFAPADVHYVKETRPTPGGGQVLENTGREVAETASELVRARATGRPFFLFAHFYDAHTDFTPAPDYRRRFVAPYSGALDGTTGQLYGLRAAGERLGPADLRFLHEMYEAEIRQLDDVLAGFFAFLEEQGLTDETLIVLTSDHGEEFQEHGGLLHGRTQYQELLRVPLILAGPGLPRGAVVAQPVGLIDLMPTILAHLGLPQPAALDGLDLAATWKGSALPERALFGEADHNNVVDGKQVSDIKRMVRFRSETLHFDRHTARAQLFDLTQDPGEQRDLAASAPERVRALQERLARFALGARAGEKSNAKASAKR
ncbi:MAG: sulfatase, partial [Planctomycetes bacterium]|nr:sulfatase [Planctomycetota bacterium]